MANMSNNQYVPNPLRPYYIPPAHDFLTGKLSSASTTASTLSSSATRHAAAASSSSPSYISSATRDMLSDLDYSDYLETPSFGGMIKDMADTAMMRYTSVLILQPFKVAKTVMQCQYVPKKSGGGVEGVPTGAGVEKRGSEASPGFAEYGGEWNGNYQEDSEDDDPPYFASNDNLEESGPWNAGSQRKKRERDPSRGRKMTDRAGRIITDATNAARPDDKPEHAWQIKTKNVGAVTEILSALWNKEGIWGVWKGSNSTFVYTVLTSTIEAWTQSFFSAVLNIPDPSITDVVDSPAPLTALFIVVTSSALTALLLAPLDIVRTRIILAPADDKPRTMLPLLKSLPSYLCPPALAVPTALHAALPSFMSAGVPYYLRSSYGIDPIVRPAMYTMCTFFSSTAELFIRLPLETSLRRAQIAVAAPRKTIVPVGGYYGVFGTLWSIYKTEEGGAAGGVEGLYRGWRVGMWGLLGMWAMGIFGGSGNSPNVSGAPF